MMGSIRYFEKFEFDLKTKLLALVVALTSSLNAFAFEIDGYKDIKFGMTKLQVQNVGSEGCAAEEHRCYFHNTDHTLLGRSVDMISVSFDDSGLVDQVIVTYPKPPVETIKDLNEALGSGARFDYVSFVGKHINGVVWLDDKKSSMIKVIYGDGEENGRLTESIFGGVVNDTSTSVYFSTGDKVTQTIEMVKESNKALDKNDF